MKKWMLVAAMAAISATVALADWSTVAEVTAGGEAKELVVNRNIRVVQIECTEGTVIVNTVVIREGTSKNPVSVARAFTQGQKQDIDLGSERQVTGLRISDGGQGKHKIHAK